MLISCFEKKYFYKKNIQIKNKYLADIGKEQDALRHLQESLEIESKFINKIHPDIAQSLNNLAQYYKFFGDNENYMKYLFNSHKMIMNIFYVKNYSDIGKSLNNADYGNAKYYFIRSLEIRKSIHHDTIPMLLKFLIMLKYVLNNQAKIKRLQNNIWNHLKLLEIFFQETILLPQNILIIQERVIITLEIQCFKTQKKNLQPR